MTITNSDRATSARRALKLFADLTGGEMNSDDENIADLISNLGHFCDQLGLDYLQIAARGIGSWSAEQRTPEPESSDMAIIEIQRGQ